MNKPVVSVLTIAFLSCAMFAQRATSRATTGTSTNTGGSCTSASGTTNTGGAARSSSQRGQTAGTPVLLTGSKTAALVQGVRILRNSRAMSSGTSASGIQLPTAVVPFH